MNTKVKKDLVEKVKTLTEEHKTSVEIARICGIKQGTVNYIRRINGIKGKSGNPYNTVEMSEKLKKVSLENEGLLYTRDDLEKQVRALEYALKHTTDDRNRYARLYDDAVEENQANQVKLWIVITVASGAAIFFGTIVACNFFNL